MSELRKVFERAADHYQPREETYQRTVERARRLRRRRRAGTALLAVVIAAGGLSAAAIAFVGPHRPAPATSIGPTASATPSTGGPVGLPNPGSVRDGRFVEPVQLDGGALRVDPAPRGTRPTFPASRAAAEAWGSPTVQGSRAGAVFGFGLVSMSRPARGVRPVTRLPAWVGFAWGGVFSCPNETGSPSPPPKLPSNGYVAVVIGAGRDSPAFTYTARSASCGRPAFGPRIARATHVVSIPWHPVRVSGARVTLRYTPPGCGRLFSLDAGGDRSVQMITVEAVVPDVIESCPAREPTTSVLDLRPPGQPGGPGRPRLRHGHVGPVRLIQL